MQTTHSKLPDLPDVIGEDQGSVGEPIYFPDELDHPGQNKNPRAGTREAQADRVTDRVNVAAVERMGSVAGGLGLMAWGVARRGWPGLLMALAGGALIRRGVTGHCALYQRLGVNSAQGAAGSAQGAAGTSGGSLGEQLGRGQSKGRWGGAGVRGHKGFKVEGMVWVNCSPELAFAGWRNLENLPCFMPEILSVKEDANGRSHWVASGPMGSRVEWDAEVVNEHPGELIAWQSLPEAEVQNAGSVRFEASQGGCLVRVALQYYSPAGSLGKGVARIFGEAPEQKLPQNLGHFKQWIETGAHVSR
jgi:uncharacterized membrane protein